MIRPSSCLSLLVALMIFTSASAEPPPPPELGESLSGFAFFKREWHAPDVPFVDRDGQAVSLNRFRGEVVLLNFWATWCPPCIAEMPALDRLQTKMGRKDFRVVAVSMDRQGMSIALPFFNSLDLTAMEPYAEEKGQLSRAFRVRGLPTSFLIDFDGRVIGYLMGPAEWDNQDATALVGHYIQQKHQRLNE